MEVSYSIDNSLLTNVLTNSPEFCELLLQAENYRVDEHGSQKVRKLKPQYMEVSYSIDNSLLTNVLTNSPEFCELLLQAENYCGSCLIANWHYFYSSCYRCLRTLSSSTYAWAVYYVVLSAYVHVYRRIIVLGFSIIRLAAINTI